jgi:O-antigen ligase
MSRVLDQVIFLSLLLIIALSAIPYGTVEPWWEALFECSIFALGILWVLEGWLSGTWHVRGSRLLLPLLSLAIFSFLQTLYWGSSSATIIAGVRSDAWRAISADPYETRLFVYKLLALCLAGELLLRYTSSRHRLRILINVVIGIATASALFGIYRQRVQGDTAGSILPEVSPALGYGQFINRNHFAFLMEMALGLVIGLVVARGFPRGRALVYLCASIPIWMALVLTDSRGGFMSMIGELLFTILLLGVVYRGRKSAAQESGIWAWFRRAGSSLFVRVALIAGLASAVVIGSVWLGGDPLVNRLETVSSEFRPEGLDSHLRVRRLEIWRATWQLIKDHPVAGVGFGGYWAALPEYYDSSGGWTVRQAHNDYLELLASGGIVGVGLGLWFGFSFLKRASKQLRSLDPFRRAACYGAAVGLFGVACHSLVDFGLHITVNSLVCIALIVIATADLSAERQSI